MLLLEGYYSQPGLRALIPGRDSSFVVCMHAMDHCYGATESTRLQEPSVTQMKRIIFSGWNTGLFTWMQIRYSWSLGFATCSSYTIDI